MNSSIKNMLKTAVICNNSEEKGAEESDVKEEVPLNSPINTKLRTIDVGVSEGSIESPAFSPLTPKSKKQVNPKKKSLHKGVATPGISEEDAISETISSSTWPLHREENPHRTHSRRQKRQKIKQFAVSSSSESPCHPMNSQLEFFNSKLECKILKYNNLPYYNRKNKLIHGKQFNNYECSCKQRCGDKVPIQDRKQVFDEFYRMGSYTAQCVYIIANVLETDKKRVCTEQKDPKKAREFSRIYTLAGTKVCKDMFINTLQISPQKVSIALKKNRTDAVIKDKRGEHLAGWNKLPEEEIVFAKNVIERVPKYVPHNRQNTDSQFLPPGTTLASLYDLYKREFDLLPDKDSRIVMSFSSFKKIFYDNFNLKFKTLKKDTCNKCKKNAIAKKNTQDLSEKSDQVRVGPPAVYRAVFSLSEALGTLK